MAGQTPPCPVCKGSTIRGIILDRDYDRDYQACFAVEGDSSGYLAPTYPGQLPIWVAACVDCGYLAQYVQPERLRERMKMLGYPEPGAAQS